MEFTRDSLLQPQICQIDYEVKTYGEILDEIVN